MTKGVVTQSFDAKTLTYEDQSSGIGTVTGRSLAIYDANNVLLATIVMDGVTADYVIAKDLYLKFIETISIQDGQPVVVTLSFRSKQFYNLAQRDLVLNGCECRNITCNDQTKAREAILAADTFFNIGDGVSVQYLLDKANILIS